MSDEPVTQWIRQLEQSDESAARELWNHFCSRLVDMARRKLHPDTRRVYDGEDAALSAFDSLCRRVADGEFPDLKDRKDLWRLLIVITSRKVGMRHRHDRRAKRDISRVRGDSVFLDSSNDSQARPTNALVSREPTPEFSAEVAETCELLYRRLEDESLRNVASLKLYGYSTAQIAQQLNCSRRTAERKLERIRRAWQREDLP